MRLLLCLLLVTSCHKKTDAERAAEERAQARKRVEDSLVLVPYRSLKSVVRASGQQPPPPELQKLITIFARMKPVAVPANALEEAAQIGELAIGLYRARSLLHKVDEDGFPTLWRVFAQVPEPLPWYSAHLEHLGLAVAAWAFEVTLNKEPVADVLFYELDRAPADPSWPPQLQAISQGARGLAYLNAGYHYASEEELTTYLANGEKLGDPYLIVSGHLARSWNRFALGRDDPGYDDLEAALVQLDKLGVDDELTDWGWATVLCHKKRYSDAAKRLEKLAQSPYLSEDERGQVKAYAAAMERQKGSLLFGKQRAQLILIRAVIARQGGMQKLLERLFGPETAKQIYEPLAFLHRLEGGVGDGAKRLGDGVTDVGKKGLDALKEKLK